MPHTSVGSRSKCMLTVLHLWRCILLTSPPAQWIFSFFFSPSVPGGSWKAFSAAKRDPLLSRGFFIPHVFVPMLSQMRPKVSTSSPCSPPSIALSSSPGSLAQGMFFFFISSMSARAQPIGKERYGMQVMKAESLLSLPLNVFFWSNENYFFFPQINMFIFLITKKCLEFCTSVEMCIEPTSCLTVSRWTCF